MKKVLAGLMLLASTVLYSAEGDKVSNVKLDRRGIIKTIQGVPTKVRSGKNYTTVVNDITAYYLDMDGELIKKDMYGKIVLADKLEDIKYVYTATYDKSHIWYGERRNDQYTRIVFSSEKLTSESFEKKFNELLVELNSF